MLSPKLAPPQNLFSSPVSCWTSVLWSTAFTRHLGSVHWYPFCKASQPRTRAACLTRLSSTASHPTSALLPPIGIPVLTSHWRESHPAQQFPPPHQLARAAWGSSPSSQAEVESSILFFCLFVFMCLFLERGEERAKERKRNIDV